MNDTMPEPHLAEAIPASEVSSPWEPITAGVSLRNNPVLRRELLERVRGAKIVVFLTLWLALLLVIFLLAFQGSVAVNRGSGLDVTELGRVGKQLFEWVLFGMLVLTLFLVPGVTAGAITGERERQTLVPLQMTMMRPRDIIIGKLSAALAFLVLLIVAALPLLGASYLVGGLTLFAIVRGIFMLVFTGLVLGSVCVWISSRLRRTTASTVLAYGLTFAFTIGSFFAMVAWAILTFVNGGGGDDPPPPELLAFNPFAGVGDALPRQEVAFGGDTISPFGGMRSMIDGFERERRDNWGDDIRGPRVWAYYLVIGTLLAVLAIRGASKAVATPADTER